MLYEVITSPFRRDETAASRVSGDSEAKKYPSSTIQYGEGKRTENIVSKPERKSGSFSLEMRYP